MLEEIMTEVVLYFLKLGFLGFGGPLALIAQMERDLVRDKKWISQQEFLQIFPLVKSMPGTIAFQMAIYLGIRRAGRWAGLLGGIALILPAFFLIIIFSYFYSEIKQNHLVSLGLEGAQAGAFALIVQTCFSLINPYKKNKVFWGLLVVNLVCISFYKIQEPILILVFGFLLIAFTKLSKKGIGIFFTEFLMTPAYFQDFSFSIIKSEIWLRGFELFWICFKAGAFIFGSGLAIVPFLKHDFVDHLGWISDAEFMDALALGQLTPGPVVIAVTFIGYKVGLLKGALIATIGIFLPSAIHMLTWFPSFSMKLRQQRWVEPFLMGAMGVIVAGILYSLADIAKDFPLSKLITSVLLFALMWYFKKWPSWVAIILGVIVTTLIGIM